MTTEKLKVYDASAGSGKTYKLSEQFADYLVEEYKDGNKEAYRHVMAVTFTNKATFEMKSRIITRLYERSVDESYEYKDVAKTLLQNLVHDYTMFRVSTIDSFFQKVLKAFAVEIGCRSSFETSLDDEQAIEAAMDRVYAKLSSREDIRQVLDRISLSRIENENNWDWRRDLLAICKKVLSSEYKNFKPSKDSISLKAKADEYKERLKVLDDVFVEKVILKTEKVKRDAACLDFARLTLDKGRTDIVKLLDNKLANEKQFYDISKHVVLRRYPESFDRWMKEPGQFLTKDGDEKDIDLINGVLKDYPAELKELYDKYYKEYMTLSLICGQIWETILLDSLSVELEDYLSEQQLALLSNSPQVLKQLIAGSVNPFVYDKIGAVIDHYLLDEFQDTSRDQWANFCPLLNEGVGRNQESFIVGDIKQSIYRWRYGDWGLLKEEVPRDFQDHYCRKRLDTNYRSLENIVLFNNILFSGDDNHPGYLVKQFMAKLDNETKDKALSDTIIEIYKGSKQKLREEYDGISSKGVVHIISCTQSESLIKQKDFILWDVARRIKDLVNSSAGYSYDDIAVLTSSRKEANDVANYLVKQGIKIVSGESLKLDSNKTVVMLIELLKKVNAPKDRGLDVMLRIGCPDLKSLESLDKSSEQGKEFEVDLKHCNTLYEICRLLLRTFLKEVPKGDFAFVKAFLDIVLEYSVSNGTSIPDFLDWWDMQRDNMCIPEPNDSEAVKIMTMHKAKGLDFKVVFVPFLRDEMIGSTAKYGHYEEKWFHTDSDVVGYSGPILLPLKKELMDSVFAEDYKKELMERSVDSLNLAYVSFTRPKERLFVYASKKPPKPKNKSDIPVISYISAALNEFCEAKNGEGKLFRAVAETLDKEKITAIDPTMELAEDRGDFAFTDYVMGEDGEKTFVENKKDEVNVTCESVNYFNASVFMNDSADAHIKIQFEDEDIIKGVLYHELFSYIDEPGNTEGVLCARVAIAVDKFLKKHPGSLIGDDKEKLRTDVLSMIEGNEHAGIWFDNSNWILVETSILTMSGTYRPDRIVLPAEGRDWAEVVDFKFGEYKKDSKSDKKYHEQVRNYMHLLQEMGYSNVKGFLWYVLEDKVVPV